jgi:integrase
MLSGGHAFVSSYELPGVIRKRPWASAAVSLGHSDIEVTMTIYAHVSLDEKRKALGKLGEVLG